MKVLFDNENVDHFILDAKYKLILRQQTPLVIKEQTNSVLFKLAL